MERYLVGKGWEGFCDRLQCASHCLDIALHYNRILCIDWTDRIWTHDDRNFFSYFDLVGVPYVTTTSQIPSHLETYPPIWRGDLAKLADEWLYDRKSEIAFDATERNHHQPIWVYPGIGHRYYDFIRLHSQMRFQPEIAAEIKRMIADVPTSLPVVHLRGTDRAVPDDRWDALRQAAPVAVVVSDDSGLAARWLAESPDSIVVSDVLAPNIASNGAGIGTHKTDPLTLKNQGYDKHQLNLRLLADFIIMARAPQAHAINQDSLFFSMSRFFGQCGGANQIFVPAPKAEKFSTYLRGYHYFFRQPT
jgi:hypothetical protein